MNPLCVLITNHSLRDPGGTELYVADLALRLLERGHRPVVYSTRLGAVAEKLLHATVPVVDSLDRIGVTPDVLHCHHSLAAAAALLKFPETPAVYVCHDWAWHHDTPPRMRRVRRILAVDQTVADRVILREGRNHSEVEVLPNGVDLRKFRSRSAPLPAAPRRALVFSNYMSVEQIRPVAEACAEHGIPLDTAGAACGVPVERPESLLPHYDLVFAKGRCAREALATGAAVIVCDLRGVGGMVLTRNLDLFQPRNFGRRLLGRPLERSTLSMEISRYDASDAGEVSLRVRSTSDLDRVVDRMLTVYRETMDGHRGDPAVDRGGELQELSRLLAWCDRTNGLWQTGQEAVAGPPSANPDPVALRVYRPGDPAVPRRAA